MTIDIERSNFEFPRHESRPSWNLSIRSKCRYRLSLWFSRLISKDADTVLTGDDTLCRKRGLGIFGTGTRHDALKQAASKKTKQTVAKKKQAKASETINRKGGELFHQTRPIAHRNLPSESLRWPRLHSLIVEW